MKKVEARVIVDATYGFGPRFRIVDAVVTERTIRYFGRNHLLRTQTFALATPEMIEEMKAIKALSDALESRARAFTELIKQSPKP